MQCSAPWPGAPPGQEIKELGVLSLLLLLLLLLLLVGRGRPGHRAQPLPYTVNNGGLQAAGRASACITTPYPSGCQPRGRNPKWGRSEGLGVAVGSAGSSPHWPFSSTSWDHK